MLIGEQGLPPSPELMQGELVRHLVMGAIRHAINLEAVPYAQQARDVMKAPSTFYGEGAVNQTSLTPSFNTWDHLHDFDKNEIEQAVNAFKVRGAFYGGQAALEANPNLRMIVSASAGNHGLGVALFARWHNQRLINSGEVRIGLDGQVVPEDQDKLLQAHIFCKEGASEDKKRMLKDLGAIVHTEVDDVPLETLEDAMGASRVFLAQNEKIAAFVHPFDDPEVMAGQSTILLETYFQLIGHGIDPVLTPTVMYVGAGGGGLGNGIATLMEEFIAMGWMHPDSHVVMVQQENCDAHNRATERLDQGRTDVSDLFAPGEFDASPDGTAVINPGENSLALTQELRRRGRIRIMTVSPQELAVQMQNDRRLEPAGALARAGRQKDTEALVAANMRQWLTDESTRRDIVRVAVNSGGNISQATRDHYDSLLVEQPAVRNHLQDLAMQNVFLLD